MILTSKYAVVADVGARVRATNHAFPPHPEDSLANVAHADTVELDAFQRVQKLRYLKPENPVLTYLKTYPADGWYRIRFGYGNSIT